MTGFFLYCLFFGCFSGWQASRKGYPPKTWFLLGVLLGVVAAGILFFQPSKAPKSHAAHLS